MGLGARPSILARLGPAAPLALLPVLLALLLAWPASVALAGGPRPVAAGAGASALEQRLDHWPAWRLPAPLPRPGRRDLIWPAWFAGEWQVSSLTLEHPGKGAEAETDAQTETGAPLRWRARFVDDGHGGVVGERAFNAQAIGTALLGDQLLAVQDDPGDPNRQLARLRGDRLLDSRVVGRRSQRLGSDLFLADELTLQVLHGPGEPRISRIETLGRWERRDDGGIDGEQWQARYGSPAEALAAPAISTTRYRLMLERLPPRSDLAN